MRCDAMRWQWEEKLGGALTVCARYSLLDYAGAGLVRERFACVLKQVS